MPRYPSRPVAEPEIEPQSSECQSRLCPLCSNASSSSQKLFWRLQFDKLCLHTVRISELEKQSSGLFWFVGILSWVKDLKEPPTPCPMYFPPPPMQETASFVYKHGINTLCKSVAMSGMSISWQQAATCTVTQTHQ